MIIDDFIKYGIENTDKAIDEIDFSDSYFWSRFSWKNYDNKIFILFEYNRFYGNIVRQIATFDGVKQDCSDGGIDEIVKKYLVIESYCKHLTKYKIDELVEKREGK